MESPKAPKEKTFNYIQANYNRAKIQCVYQGIVKGKRPQPTLDEARAELSEAISRVANFLFKDKYGPLLGAVSQSAINEFLKGFEPNITRAQGDLTLVLEELIDRVIPKIQRNKE